MERCACLAIVRVLPAWRPLKVPAWRAMAKLFSRQATGQESAPAVLAFTTWQARTVNSARRLVGPAQMKKTAVVATAQRHFKEACVYADLAIF